MVSYWILCFWAIFSFAFSCLYFYFFLRNIYLQRGLVYFNIIDTKTCVEMYLHPFYYFDYWQIRSLRGSNLKGFATESSRMSVTCGFSWNFNKNLRQFEVNLHLIRPATKDVIINDLLEIPLLPIKTIFFLTENVSWIYLRLVERKFVQKTLKSILS